MTKDRAWNIFKNTGDINMYLEFKGIEQVNQNMKENLNETNKGKWDNFS